MLSFVSSRVGRASTTVLAIAVLALGAGAPAAQAAPLEEEVTTEWVCELQPHRVTEFQLGEGTAALFNVRQFDPSMGDFRGIDVTQEVELITSMTVTLASAASVELIRVVATHELWTNIPPTVPRADTPPPAGERADHLYVEEQLPWADGIYPTGFSDLGTQTRTDASSFTSSDATTWVGHGSIPVTLQTRSSVALTGAGGNGAYEQQTTAEAEVCYRYTYVPVADELDPEPTPEPEADPDPEPTVRPEPKPRTLPDTGITDSPALALAAASAIVAGALLLSRRHHRLPILRRLAD